MEEMSDLTEIFNMFQGLDRRVKGFLRERLSSDLRNLRRPFKCMESILQL